MAPKRKICDKDTESELMCDIDWAAFDDDEESYEDEDVYDNEQPPQPLQQQLMTWGLRPQVNKMHADQWWWQKE